MRPLAIFLLITLGSSALSQTISPARQQALNNYIEYLNNAEEAVDRVTVSIIKYYPDLIQQKAGKYRMTPRYACPVQQEDYYFNKALNDSKALDAAMATSLNSQLKNVAAAAGKIDAACKALDTYHKLEDFKQDSFAKAEKLVQEIILLVQAFDRARDEMIHTVEAGYSKLQPKVAGNAYHTITALMIQAMNHEKSLLDTWSFNLESGIHSGWDTDRLKESILETDRQIKLLDQTNVQVKYPASSMVTSFKEGMRSILEQKRNALDGYNNEAKNSDQHSNDAYLGLINYYNGTLVSFYNSFVKYARQDGHQGLFVATYSMQIAIRSEAVHTPIKVAPFKDNKRQDIQIVQQQKPITKGIAVALNNYVDFINEALRQTKFLQLAVGNFSSSAARYKGLTSYEGRGPLRFDFSNFTIPHSQYQKTIAESSVVPSGYKQQLNDQTSVLLSVLTEMEQLSALLKEELADKKYEKDNLDKVYQVLERYRYLFEVMDDRKEQLYTDVRAVYDSYPVAGTDTNWIRSWQALRRLADYDHAALFQAKAYYKNKSSTLPNIQPIEEQLRLVLEKEFDNMKGIEKLGRYNGRCPYTPYEDMPKTSRQLSEKLQKIQEPKSTTYQHPYHDLVYLYNNVVDDYNKFCDLSNLTLLHAIHQPELFELKYPEGNSPVVSQDKPAAVVVTPEEKPKTETTQHPVKPEHTSAVSVVRDTVYIERHDTVYLTHPDENLRSMEGYATNNMVLLVDVSGSMNAPDKLPLLKQSLLNMLSMMREEDQVSLVTYSGKAKVILPPTSFKQEDKIRKAIHELTPSGKTDGNAGIKLAYQVADKNYVRGGNNRIILATDGEFPVGKDVFTLVERFSNEDVFISVFNFGSNKSSSRNLERLASNGRGNYEYITPDNMEIKLIREAKAKRKK